MCRDLDSWKEPYRQAIEASIKQFSNTEKLNREKWVAKRLLQALSVEFDESSIRELDEPADVGVLDARFQVKELMDDGRRRGDEFKKQLDVLDAAGSLSDLSERCKSKSISFESVVDLVDDKAAELEKGKYGPAERRGMDLLCYFNFLDYFITPPLAYSTVEGRGFRSISVVTNHYCSVLYTNGDAPEFLHSRVGDVVERVQT